MPFPSFDRHVLFELASSWRLSSHQIVFLFFFIYLWSRFRYFSYCFPIVVAVVSFKPKSITNAHITHTHTHHHHHWITFWLHWTASYSFILFFFLSFCAKMDCEVGLKIYLIEYYFSNLGLFCSIVISPNRHHRRRPHLFVEQYCSCSYLCNVCVCV